jgi:DNA-binding transcriptional LysR family regulator
MVKKALLGQVSDSEIRLLRIFKVVVDSGGLSAAELELNIGRSTVSRHLKDLETRLGLVLCRRGRAGFALTPDGQRVYDGAQRLLDAMDGFRNDVREMHAELVGTLAMGLFDKTITNPQARLSQAIGDFRSAAPSVSLDITVASLNEIESGVIDGRLHLGIVPDHRRSDSLDYLELFDEAMYLYCGRSHPLFGRDHARLAWDEIQACDHAALAFHSPNMEATQRLNLRRQATASDQEAIALLILSGHYVGFLPDHYADDFVRKGLIERVAHPDCRYAVRFVAITRRSPGPSRPVRAFLDALAAAHRPGAVESTV